VNTVADTSARPTVRNYALVTGAYWGFTVTDGAIHMLVLLHFYRLGYTPLQLGLLFVLYEVCGIATNLVGGWVAARLGLRVTLLSGLALQIAALAMLSPVDGAWDPALSVAYVTAALALSGVAKDLTKMSSKSAIKVLLPGGAEGRLFRWVALLTGSKNALKGAGFFVGAALLAALGFSAALLTLAGALLLVWTGTALSLPGGLGRAKGKAKFTAVFSKNRDINVLSAARLFLFGSRDVWFAVALPLFLAAGLGWGFAEVGGFMALWVIGYGIVQSAAPQLLGVFSSWGLGGKAPGGRTALVGALALAALPAATAWALPGSAAPAMVVVTGLLIFGAVFALNSSLHSYLILAYTTEERAALDVGFYYSANAAGRLTGTFLSGVLFQWAGLVGCLWASAAFLLIAAAWSAFLPAHVEHEPPLAALGEGGE
jgi:predicted MFS family arabinose efflux permease